MTFCVKVRNDCIQTLGEHRCEPLYFFLSGSDKLTKSALQHLLLDF